MYESKLLGTFNLISALQEPLSPYRHDLHPGKSINLIL
jgi:hypothetical protein